MDCGPISGWMGTLNDWFTNAGFADFSVRSGDLYDGDVIRVMYSCDGGPDLGGDYATAEGYLNSLSVSAGDLEPAFAKDTMAYTLTADSGVRTVDVSAAAENKQDRVTVAANGTEYHRGENVPAADGTEITVTCGIPGGEKIKTYTITVAREGGEIAVEKVELDKTALELDAGETETLTAAVTPDNATDKTVVWTSSDDAVATVENGKVTAVAAGEATITATAGGKRASCAVTVKAAQEMVEKTVSIPVKNIWINCVNGPGSGVPTFEQDPVKIESSSTSTKWYGAGSPKLSIPAGESFTITCGGKTIKSVFLYGGVKMTNIAVNGVFGADAYKHTYEVNDTKAVITLADGVTQAKLSSGTDLVVTYLDVAPPEYTVTLPSGDGYTASAAEGFTTTVTAGGSFSFTVSVSDGYGKTDSFAVKANGVSLTADETGVYTISDIQADQTITVEGLEKQTAVTIVAPTGSVVSIGTLQDRYVYHFADSVEPKDNGDGTANYVFECPTTKGSKFLRVQHPDGVTYWDYNAPVTTDGAKITVTAEQLFLNSTDFTAKTQYHDFQYVQEDVADIYLTANASGYLNLNPGETFDLNVLRSWQALPDFFTDTIALPDVHYRVIDFSGNDSDVVAVTPDAQNSSLATITANQAGTAVVLVTYDAALSAKANGTASRYSAIWPENTGVLVVSVGADGTGLTTNMTLNDGLTNYSRHEKNAGYAIDAEQDVLYYTGSEGASYTFTPPAGSTVSVAKAALTGESLTYNGFADVPANADGSVTLTGLTTGSHIVKVEQGGTATYQVIRAKQTTLTLTHEDGSAITAENPVYPGDTVLVSFGALYNPVNKIAGIYNTNCNIAYLDENGNLFAGGNGTGADKPNGSSYCYGVYTFAASSNLHQVKITVPADWDKSTYTLKGYLATQGYGSTFGSHRGVSYVTGVPKTGALSADVFAVMSSLPQITISVEKKIAATGITLDKTELNLDQGLLTRITASVEPGDTTDSVIWTSSDEAVATVDSTGLVKTVGVGTATITATAGTVSAQCTITVSGYVNQPVKIIDAGVGGYSFFDLTGITVYGADQLSMTTAASKKYDVEVGSKCADSLHVVLKANVSTNNTKSKYFWCNGVKSENPVGSYPSGETDYYIYETDVTPVWDDSNQMVLTLALGSSSKPTGNKTYTITLTKVATYSVTLPVETVGYTIAPAEGSTTTVRAGGSFSFNLSVADGYEKSSAFAVKANGEVLTADESGLYTIKNIASDVTVNVEGVISEAEAGKVVADIYQKTGDYLQTLTLTNNDQWKALGLARSGREVSDGFYSSVVSDIKANIDTNQRLDKNKSSENSRAILALTALGYDVTNVGGHNLLKGLGEMAYLQKQGINGPIWALIALDSHNYDPTGDVTRAKLLNVILEAELADGGWALSGTAADVDMTAMALQSLAPYYGSNERVTAAVDKALELLSGLQKEDGSFPAYGGTSTSESTAQVIVALSTLKIDAGTDTRFIKNGNSALDGLCAFAVEDGGFRHLAEGDRNSIATEQGYYALAAYFRMKEGKTALYDMTDVDIRKIPVYAITSGGNGTWVYGDGDVTLVSDGKFSEFTGVEIDGKVVNSGNYTAGEGGNTAVTLKASWLGTLAGGKHTVTLAFGESSASTTLNVVDAAASSAQIRNVENLINAIGTVTKSSKAKIDAARSAYNALTDYQKKQVTNYSTLTWAEKTYEELKNKITVYFSLLGDSAHGDNGKVHTYSGGGLTTWISKTAYTVTAPATVLDVFETAVKGKYSYTNKGNYISAVNGLAEFANGTYSGWMYTLNGSYPLQGVEEQQVRDGDVIVFHYTDDYRVERTGYTSDTSGAEKVIQLIDKIGTVTLNSKDAIRAARKAYEGLSAAEKEKVTNYKTLTAAESRLSQLQIQDAINKISLIGTVTLNSGSKLDTAWNAYNALTAEQKLKVTNRGTLSQAQETYNALKAEETEKFIDEIDDVITLESEEDIVKARKAYDALSKTQQGLVDKEYLDKLKAAEQALAALKASEDDRKEAQQVIQLIDQLGTITLDSEKDVEAARAAYEKLTDIQKALVTNYEKLVAAEAALESKKTFAVFEDAYITTGDYMESLGVPGVGSIGGEWMVIGLARSGRTVPEGFYDNVLSFVEENIDENQSIHQAKSTENSRLILALTAIGKDVTNVGGHDLLEGLKEMEYVSYQGLNGTIWALIAFDCGNYPVPEDGDVTREALVQTILDAQLADGGWALVGEEADADMTGMALQSLAPYYGSSEAVKLAVDSAVETLSLMQNADGSFSSVDGASSESISQIIVALTALGIDPGRDERFIKNDCSAVDALISYYVTGGGFKHILTGQRDGMATEQAYYALTAYYRFLMEKNSLYDMTDVIDMGGDPEVEATVPVETEEVEQPEEKNSFPWWIILVVLCAGGACAALVILIPRLKKGKIQ